MQTPPNQKPQCCLCLAALVIIPIQARAFWIPNGAPVCTLAVSVRGVGAGSLGSSLVSDAAGGVFVFWHDERNFDQSDTDIYAQHLSRAGAMAPGWPAEGLRICKSPMTQVVPVLTPDGSGGVLATWTDSRNGSHNTDIYAQRVLAGGAIPLGWMDDGVAVCNAPSYQLTPCIASDGMGGTIVAWEDVRTGTHIFAQRLTPAGTLAPGWPVDGRVVCDTTGFKYGPAIVTDAAGGAILAWRDYRSGVGAIYVKRIDPSGATASGWPEQGLLLRETSAIDSRSNPRILSDDDGGAYITWEEDGMTPGLFDRDIFVQRVTASGAVAPGWPDGGLPVGVTPHQQMEPVMITDGTGGVFIAWHDGRTEIGLEMDIYAQRLTAVGTIVTGWPVDGLGVCTLRQSQEYPAIASDGAGGAIMAWEDARNGARDVYAQRLLGSGTVAPGWPAGGEPVCIATREQRRVRIVLDGEGGAVISWEDERSGTSIDLYAQRLGPDGDLVTAVDFNSTAPTRLAPAWPNPFRERTHIVLFLPADAATRVDIFDVSGRLVCSLANAPFAQGPHVLVWDGRGNDASRLPAGTYLVRARWPGFDSSRKIALAR